MDKFTGEKVLTAVKILKKGALFSGHPVLFGTSIKLVLFQLSTSADRWNPLQSATLH